MIRRILVVFAALTVAFSGTQVTTAEAASKAVTFTADVWADNWFAMYVNGVKVAQDPVPITTQKSFNKVSFTFNATYPLYIAVVAKDYVDDKTGLEYIGTPNQQIGDAGLIAQIYEKSSGKLVAYSSSAWRSYVLFKAPLNPSCVTSKTPAVDCQSSVKATPASWYSTSYNYSAWPTATKYDSAQVGPKDGYYEVAWSSKANFIWSSSLTLDNTVLFRTKVTSAPATSAPFNLKAPQLSSAALLKDNTCDGIGAMPTLSWTGTPASAKSLLLYMDTPAGPVRPGEVAQTDFTHLLQYNIPISTSTLTAKLEAGQSGRNFKGSLGYAPPCSQGPGEKTYTFHLLALSESLSGASLSGTQALAAAKPLMVAEASLALSYTRP